MQCDNGSETEGDLGKICSDTTSYRNEAFSEMETREFPPWTTASDARLYHRHAGGQA